MVRYTRALDETNHHNSFVQLWSLLEHLTSTLHDTYDKTIKRTAFLYEDVDYHFSILDHLRRHRNQIVHTGSNNDFTEHLVCQTKFYVDELIEFHLANHYSFSSIAEAGEMLDSATEVERLRTDIEKSSHYLNTLESAMKFRKYSKL